MKIAIDLSALQGAHRMRGIGSVLINFINYLPDEALTEHSFVFFVLPGALSDGDPFDLLKLRTMRYDIRQIKPVNQKLKQLPGKLRLINSIINQLHQIWVLRRGSHDIRSQDLKDVDIFFQIDPGIPLPKSRKNLKTVLFLHDLIPYILEWDYMWSYTTARLHGYSWKAALRVHVARILYLSKYKVAINSANTLLANCEHTKKDFVRYFSLSPLRIIVTHLGVEQPDKVLVPLPPVDVFRNTSWGYLAESYKFDAKIPFLLFVGGADRRRKLQDLITAFNRLRGQGIAIHLVLAGDSMYGPMGIGTEEIQHALKTSSYLDDILFLGFTHPRTLRWLYDHALAFVFPSRYEGFGLPVLEAMTYGTPVITYKNAAIQEVAGTIPIYVPDALGIEVEVKKLLIQAPSPRHRKESIDQAAKFTWEKTSSKIIESFGR